MNMQTSWLSWVRWAHLGIVPLERSWDASSDDVCVICVCVCLRENVATGGWVSSREAQFVTAEGDRVCVRSDSHGTVVMTAVSS